MLRRLLLGLCERIGERIEVARVTFDDLDVGCNCLCVGLCIDCYSDRIEEA